MYSVPAHLLSLFPFHSILIYFDKPYFFLDVKGFSLYL
jgi:hypothetical protein